MPLSEEDEVFVEKCFQRSLIVSLSRAFIVSYDTLAYPHLHMMVCNRDREHTFYRLELHVAGARQISLF